MLALVVGGLTLFPLAGAVAQEESTPRLLRVGFGPSEIWHPSAEAMQALFGCSGTQISCVEPIMRREGATDDAVEFYRLTGWFLSDIQNTGVVQWGTIFVPWRANENTQYAFLGGVPAVIFAEHEAEGLPLQRDPDYQALVAEHPEAKFWAPGPRLEGMDVLPEGGQRFVLRYRILDGCHACAIFPAQWDPKLGIHVT